MSMISMPEFMFEITRAELSKHLEVRVTHHRERSKFYVDKAASLRETAEKCAAGEQVTLPDEILEAISVGPDYAYSPGPYRPWKGGMGAVMSAGAVVRQEAAGARKRLESAQDAIKSQVAEQVERLIWQYEGTSKVHDVAADMLTFFLAHLPATAIKYELTHGDLLKFELVPSRQHDGDEGYLAQVPRYDMLG